MDFKRYKNQENRNSKRKGFTLLQKIFVTISFIVILTESLFIQADMVYSTERLFATENLSVTKSLSATEKNFVFKKASASTTPISVSQKNTKPGVISTLKNGVFTVKGKGAMPDSAMPTASQKKKIKKIVVKKGVTSLPEFAFKNCKKATSIKIASSVKKIGMQAFAKTSVKKLTIPKTTENIGWGICMDCDLLETLVIPGKFNVLKPSFDHWLEPFVTGKNSLKTVKFSTALNPELVRMAGDCVNFEVLQDDPEFKSIDGIIYTKDGKTLVRIPYARSEAVIANGCETVAVGSFTYLASGHHEPYIYPGCKVLKSIVFPSSVKKVTDKVYSDHAGAMRYNGEGNIQLNMSGLDTKSIKTLWEYCEWRKTLASELVKIGCASITDGMVVLNNGYLCGYIGDEKNITEGLVQYADGTTGYGKYEEITVPGNVKIIGKNAFSRHYTSLCTDYPLKSVILGNNVELIEDYAFYLNPDIKVYIKNKNIKISDTAFKDCATCEFSIL